MCGIFGCWGYAFERPDMEALTATLAHRGPDASGTYRSPEGGPPLWLGHRRLAIIDVSSAADQPFRKNGLVVVFNGEIYNYRALRRELEAEGITFRSDSDTEVLLEGWRCWGDAVFPRLRGMFAVGIYDEARHQLVLARDRFGIKPLFVLHRPDRQRFAFASELKALRRLEDDGFDIDPTAFASVLVYDWIPEEHCIYAGIAKLAPGCVMTVTANGAPHTSRYWNAEGAFEDGAGISVEELGDVVRDSVQQHLVADVEVGAFLSGGLDSSLIAAMAGQRLRTFAIGFRQRDNRIEAMADDLVYARQAADALGVPLHAIELDPDVQRLLPRMVDVLDEPIGDSAAVNVLLLCEAARQAGLKVMLSGMGADEMFGGYRRHLACLLATRYRQMPVFTRAAVRAVLAKAPVASGSRGLRLIRWAKRFSSFAELPEEPAYRRSYSYYEPDELLRLSPTTNTAILDRLVAEHRDVYWHSGKEPGREAQLRRMFYTDLHFFLPALNLTYTDRASMAASVEVRVPFVDHVVVAAAARLAGRDRIRGRVQKYLLKKAARQWLPRAIIERPKSSFGMPLRAWTMNELREPIRDVLPHGSLVSNGYLDRSVLEQVIGENERGEADHAQALWQLLTLEYWFRQTARAERLRSRAL